MSAREREPARQEAQVEGLDALWFRLCPAPLEDDPLLGDLARALADPALRAQLEADDAAERYPEAALTKLRALGLPRVFAEVDGPTPRATAFHQAGLCVLAAQSTTGLAITLGVNSLALLTAYLAAEPQQLEAILTRVSAGTCCALLLTELDAGSNLLAGVARAEPLERGADGELRAASGPASHYRLDGAKELINGGERHGLLFAFLRTQPAPGPEVDLHTAAAQARGAHSMVWLERQEGVIALPRWRTLPARGADISGVRFEGAVIPASQRLGAEGEGFDLVSRTLSISRGGISALAVGTATRARSLALAYAVRRSLYGAPIAELGAIAEQLLRLDALQRVASATSLRAMAWVNAAGLNAAPYTAVAKLVACQLAEEAVDEGRRVLGGRALLAELPYERVVRDVLLYGVFDGTSHLMREDLQMRLAMELRRAGRPAGDTLAAARQVYDVPPRSLVAALRAEGPQGVPLLAHARALAALPGEASLEPLAELAAALLALTQACKDARRWGDDQALRHDLAEVYASVEALVALVELHDPQRRPRLVSRPLRARESDALGYRFAIGWLGGRACARLAERAAELDADWLVGREPELAARDGLAGIQRRFLRGQAALRGPLAAALLAETSAR